MLFPHLLPRSLSQVERFHSLHQGIHVERIKVREL
jgi:hypothetical protein